MSRSSKVPIKETVHRYIDEFERLLAEAAKDDRDSMAAKTY